MKKYNLDNKEIEDVDTIIALYCCKACFYAENEPCTCRCGGKHHGKGKLLNRPKDLDMVKQT